MKKLIVLLLLLISFTCSSQNSYIQIISESDISIFLDGIFKGKTSMDIEGLIIENVTPGKHTIRVFKEGYEAHDSIVNVKQGEVLTIKLKPLIHTSQIDKNKQQAYYECNAVEKVYKVKKHDFKRFQAKFSEAVVFGGTDATEEELSEVNNLSYGKNIYYEIILTSNKALPDICTKYDIQIKGKDIIEKTYSYYLKNISNSPPPLTMVTKISYSFHSIIKLKSPLKSKLTITFQSGKIKTIKP